MKCRFCSHEVHHEFIDLLNAPPSNAYLTFDQLDEPEIFYPLNVLVCEQCFLVQVDEYKKSDEIFDADYAYFSSMSSSWVEHAKNYVEMITEKQKLSSHSHVIEIASNDGYLLQFFYSKNIPCLGVEPTKSTADVARAKGINVIEDFFGETLAGTLQKADVILGNNVLAHVPNINDFVKGLKVALKHDGVITMEFPHLLNLIEKSQFDTIYHEHFSYLSLMTTMAVFKAHGLQIYDVEELVTHGGSLRIYATHIENDIAITTNVKTVLEKEASANLDTLEGYKGFQEKANKIKYDFLNFLLHAKAQNKKVIGYGAAAKGNTLLNYCGVKNDLIDFVVDKAPLKVGKYLPGSHIPIVMEENIKEAKPDFVIIFPWNIQDEIMKQLSYIREWNGQFVVAIPHLEIL
ncbi:methyltransferase domain-containing protein [Sulfuricurvum sp.]|uniref:methyltransferase domain-containing protein n=1 Tax=Sulfuricurvum sp. TaxID=2025608 RepID=UPI0035695A7B